MLMLREQQREAMRQYAVEQYAHRALRQFQKYFPTHCRVLGDKPVLAMIVYGVARARRHEIVAECNVTLYVSLMLLLGSRFDEDPMYPWANLVLKDPSLNDESIRAEQLYDAGVDFWERMGGPDNRYLVVALSRCQAASPDRFASMPEEKWPEEIAELFPRKARMIPDTCLRQIVAESRQTAARYGLSEPEDRAVIAVLMFMLGHRFDDDPLYPWARETLTATGVSRDLHGTTDMRKAAYAHAEAWLAQIPKEDGGS